MKLKNLDNDIEMLQMTRHKFSNLFHKGTQTKSQLPVTHQLILENLLQVPAQVTFVREYGFENCLRGHPYKSRCYCGEI